MTVTLNSGGRTSASTKTAKKLLQIAARVAVEKAREIQPGKNSSS